LRNSFDPNEIVAAHVRLAGNTKNPMSLSLDVGEHDATIDARWLAAH
jgi:hypothetical protein